MTGSSPRPWQFRHPVRISAAVFVVLALMVAAGLVPTGARPGPSSVTASVSTSAPTSYNWPEIHDDPQLTGYISNTTLSASNASRLGVRWATELYASAVDSPSVAYDAALRSTLVYIGTEAGDLLAVNLANGQIVWGNWLGSPVVSSPVVNDGSVYVATQRNSAIFNINATTGHVICSAPSRFIIEATATVATPPGGVRTVYIGSENTGVNGPFYAMNAANCKIEWKFSDYNVLAGSWDPSSYVVTKNGTPLVLLGTSDPDSTVYALNAVTGKLVWKHTTIFPPGGNWDIGAGVTISAPGANGLPYGAAYAINKYGNLVALNLSSGAQIWSENINNLTGSIPPSRSTPALLGTNLVLGHNGGLLDVDPGTGAILWQYTDPSETEIISSPAIAGPNAASAMVVAGDLGGSIDVVALANGSQLYTYQTGNYITASPAISDGNILIASSDGLLYDLAVNGGNDVKLPTTAIRTPANGATLTNPNGNETVRGNATDVRGVAAVEVAIEAGGVGGAWWDGALGEWVSGPYNNAATLAHSGATTTNWTYAFPVARGGDTYAVTANAVSVSGQENFLAGESAFTVLYSRVGPYLTASPEFVAPGGTTVVKGGGFAASEKVAISYLGRTLATVASNGTGALPAHTITLPTNASFGLAALNATGLGSGRTATAAITILNNWDQAGYDPAHLGDEPNDPTFYDLIAVGTGNYLHVAWDFVSGASLAASPVIADNVAYVANSRGAVYALDVPNGGELWSTTLPRSAPADGSLAVDPSTGLLFAGVQNGSLIALRTANGSIAWSDAWSYGALTAPVYASGVLYVATGAGRVVSVSESTGTVRWSKNLSSAITGAPTLDTTDGELIVGTAGGSVVALNATDGARIWSFSASGAVTASAVVSDGQVYVGSAGGDVYDLNAATGAEKWKYDAHSPINDTGAISYAIGGKATDLAIGANNGITYVLALTTGRLSFTASATGAVVGVSTVESIIVVDHANGGIDAFRNYADFGVFHCATTGTLATTPVIANGAIFLAAGDGDLYAFVGTEQPPV
jgi:outer membrane protein assembly factor BamB